MRFLILFCLLLPATLLAQQRGVPLKNATLQSDLNAGGYYITNAAGITDVNGDPIVGGGGASTNGLATTNYVNSITNGFASTDYADEQGQIAQTAAESYAANEIAALRANLYGIVNYTNTGTPTWTNSIITLNTNGFGGGGTIDTNNLLHVGQQYDFANGTGTLATASMSVTNLNALAATLNGETLISSNTVAEMDAVVSGRLETPPDDFYIVNIGDLHIGIVDPNITANTNSALVEFTNAVTTMLAWKAAGTNIIAFTSPGDIYDSGTQSNSIVELTNQLWRLKSAGILPVFSPGNHETGGAAHWWESYLGTNMLSGGAYYKDGTNTRQAIYAFTNRSFKLAFVCGNGADTPSTIRYAQTNFSDHKQIVLTHQYYDAFGAFSPSYNDKRTAIRDNPNVFAILSGHWRCGLAWGHKQENGNHGQCQTCLFQNAQQMTNAGNNIMRVYKISPSRNTVFASTYDNKNSLWLTNGIQNAVSTRGQSNGYFANFTFPINGPSLTPAVQRGNEFTIANPTYDESDGAVVYSAQTNALPDIITGWERATNGGVYDGWYITRTRTNDNLELRYVGYSATAEGGAQLAAVKAQIDTNGTWMGKASYADDLPTKTNIVVVRGAGSGTTYDGVYVRAGTSHFTNTVPTKWITNNGSYWVIGRAPQPSAYTNATLIGKWFVAAGTAPGPVSGYRYLASNDLAGEAIFNATNFYGKIAIGDVMPTNGIPAFEATNLFGTLSGNALTATTATNWTKWGTNAIRVVTGSGGVTWPAGDYQWSGSAYTNSTTKWITNKSGWWVLERTTGLDAYSNNNAVGYWYYGTQTVGKRPVSAWLVDGVTVSGNITNIGAEYVYGDGSGITNLPHILAEWSSRSNTLASPNFGANTWGLVTNTWTNGNITMAGWSATNNAIYYTNSVGGMVHSALTISFKQSSGAAANVAFKVHKNGTPIHASMVEETANSTTFSSTAMHPTFSVEPGDKFELYGMVDANTAITVRHANWVVFSMK